LNEHKKRQLPTMHTWPIGRIAISGRIGGDEKQRQTKIYINDKN